jgi:hypothetical protein
MAMPFHLKALICGPFLNHKAHVKSGEQFVVINLFVYHFSD